MSEHDGPSVAHTDPEGYGRYGSRGCLLVDPPECIDAIQAALSDEEFRGFVKGCCIKYLWREADKGGDVDLFKAEDYLHYLRLGSWLHDGDEEQR